MPEFAGMTRAVIRRPEKQREKKRKAVESTEAEARTEAEA
jgi:hypothetical protein